MKAVFSNLLALTLVASHVAPVALAAPVASSKQEERSLKAVGTAIAGGIASGAAGALVSDLLNKREPEVEERSLKAVGAAVAGGIASGAAGAIVGDLLNKRSLTAIENFFGSLFNKRSEPSGLMVDTETGIIYMEVPDANEGRSLKAIGTAVAGGVASLATGAAINHFLGDKRSESPSGLFVDTETGTLYMDVADENETRSLKAIGTAVAGGVASLATGAAINHFLGDKRSEPSGLMVDTETGILYMDVPEANDARSLKAIGTAVAGGIASGAAGAVISNLLNRDVSGLMVDTETGTIYADLPDAPEARSLKAIGTAVAGGIASGAAGAVISNLFNRDVPSDLYVDTETGVLYMNVADANEGRSLKAIGTAVAGGIASGAAGAVISNLLNRDVSGIMVDTETGTIYADIPDANEGRSLKAIGTAVAGGIASGAAGAVISNLLNRDVSGLMVDTETGVIYADIPDANEARSLKAIGTAVAGGIASGAAGAIVKDIFDKRSELSGIMVDTETGTIYADVPDAVEGRSLKAVGTAIAGGIASGAAGAIVSDLFNKREELDERSSEAIINFLDEHFHLPRSELDARSFTAIGNLFHSIFGKRDVSELDARSLSAIGNLFHSIFGKRDIDELD